MACCPKSIIEDVLKKHDKITHVYFVACGGSYAGLYPAKYFLQSEAKDLIIVHYSSNAVLHATPKALGKDSIVITSLSPAPLPRPFVPLALRRKLALLLSLLPMMLRALLAKNGDHVVTYGTTKEPNDNGHAKALWLAVEILNQIEGYAHYDAFMASYEKYNEIVPVAKEKFAPTAKAWAEKYGEEKLIYVMGSGPNFGVTYSYAICLLQEMQWIHSSAIHSGEYFHGPFEITDKDVPFIMMMSTGRTRALDQRALDFLHRFGEKIMVLDNEEMGLNALDPNVAEFFNQIFTAALLDMFYMDLCEVRKHPRPTRRYMWKLKY